MDSVPDPLPPQYPYRPRRRRNSSVLGWIAALAVIGVVIAFALLATGTLPGPATNGGNIDASSSSMPSMPAPASSSAASSQDAMSSQASSEAVASSSVAPAPAPSSASMRSAEGGLSASRTVVTFYQDWATFKGSPMKAAHYEGSPYITESLRASLRSHADAAIDPVVCAGKDPPSFEVISVKQQGAVAATGTVRENYAEGTVDVTVTLKSEGGMWKVDTITCPSQPTRPLAKAGEFCGGIANLQCEAGLTCKLEGNFPDAGGTCVK